jgi:hypothetical protein
VLGFRLGDVVIFEKREPVTAAKFIIKVHCLFYCLALFVGWNFALDGIANG